jgi:plasmid stabilization system protein ParE
LTVVYRSDALADVVGAKNWYDAQQPGLGEEFVVALDRSLSLITRMPGSFPIVHRDVQRALLRRFPYALYFRQRDEAIEVIACLHTRRDPHTLHGRVN